MKETRMVVGIIHRFGAGRCATERVSVNYISEMDARMIKHFMITSPGKEPATYYFEGSYRLPLSDIVRFEKWIEQPMT